MASSIIHIAVANEVNKNLKRNKSEILIGSIAPDISKLVGETKEKSHFLDDVQNDIPNINKFLEKYKSHLKNDFVMGYYIHLYTDYLWFKYFMSEILNHDVITKLDGTKIKCNDNILKQYMYNDYTNLNIQLIDEYQLDLDIFANQIPNIENIIKEIPIDQIQIIIDQAGIIIANTKTHKDFIFNIDNIKNFIETSTMLIIANIEQITSNG